MKTKDKLPGPYPWGGETHPANRKPGKKKAPKRGNNNG